MNKRLGAEYAREKGVSRQYINMYYSNPYCIRKDIRDDMEMKMFGKIITLDKKDVINNFVEDYIKIFPQFSSLEKKQLAFEAGVSKQTLFNIKRRRSVLVSTIKKIQGSELWKKKATLK